MNISEQIKDLTGHQVSKMIVELLRRVSDERLVQLTYLGEQLTSDYEILGAIKGVRNMLETPDHPAKKLFRGVLEYLPPKNRSIIFNTLFNNLCFDSLKRVPMAPFLFSQDYELFDNESLFAIVKLRG